jgi:hypothetical protein
MPASRRRAAAALACSRPSAACTLSRWPAPTRTATHAQRVRVRYGFPGLTAVLLHPGSTVQRDSHAPAPLRSYQSAVPLSPPLAAQLGHARIRAPKSIRSPWRMSHTVAAMMVCTTAAAAAASGRPDTHAAHAGAHKERERTRGSTVRVVTCSQPRRGWPARMRTAAAAATWCPSHQGWAVAARWRPTHPGTYTNTHTHTHTHMQHSQQGDTKLWPAGTRGPAHQLSARCVPSGEWAAGGGGGGMVENTLRGPGAVAGGP